MSENSINLDDLQKLLQLIKMSGAKDMEALKKFYADETDSETEYIEVATPVTEEPVDRTSDSYFFDYTNKYIDFTYENPTTLHVVSHFGDFLKLNGFTYLSERDDWSGLKAGKYFTTRSGLCLAAFVLGADWKPEYGVGVLGSHIDALTVKLKPNSTKSKVEGYELIGVAPYAGALSDKWWDRDLGYGGRVLIRTKDSSSKTGYKTTSKLINSTPKPIGRIASLAPHFGAPALGPFNKETQMVPIIGYDSGAEPEPTEDEKNAPLYGKHSLKFLRHVAKLAEVEVKDLYELELDMFDVQKGTIGGLNNEFLFAPRIDDRICSFSGINSIVELANSGDIPLKSFSMVTVYDNEELGSLSRQGAKGGLIEAVVDRVIGAVFPEDDVSALTRLTYANSIILSVDVTHLYNPNFPNVYLENHRPKPNTGLTVALDSNGHMATDTVGLTLVEQIAELNGDKLQYFQIRNDSRSGGTIGPSISSQTGARTIDMGIPQLSMHSIRAAAGSKDIGLAVKFFVAFFKTWRDIYDTFEDL